MKKKYYFIIVYILFVIILSISICKTLDPQKLGKIYSSLYEPLDYYINVIETNMGEVAISNGKWNWSKLKETNLADDKLKTTYNLLVSDIRTCYLLSNDLENETYDNMKILGFKNKRHITGKEILELNKNESCLENFDKYNSLTLSDNKNLSEKVRAQINIIIDYKSEPSTYRDFGSLLLEESATISKIASLTNWLKIEYYSNK